MKEDYNGWSESSEEHNGWSKSSEEHARFFKFSESAVRMKMLDQLSHMDKLQCLPKVFCLINSDPNIKESLFRYVNTNKS